METLVDFLDKNVEKDLASIISALSFASVMIKNQILEEKYKINLGEIKFNKSGDFQKKLDSVSNSIVMDSLIFTDNVSAVISEEIDEKITIDNGGSKYLLAYDPLDGSSNIECDGELGTIFGIYRDENKIPEGKDIVCAGYFLYSSVTTFVLTFGEEVLQFYLDYTTVEYIRSKENLVLPVYPKNIISCNFGNLDKWSDRDKKFVKYSKDKKYTCRYSGCMVMDAHRILKQGGIFLYPKDITNETNQGKLRLLYECFPISFILESANGVSFDGNQRILNLAPTSIHQKSPIYIGCKRDITILKNIDSISSTNISRNLVQETFCGSGEDEILAREGDLVSSYSILNDPKWARVTLATGETGIIPTKNLLYTNL